jgi:hypothetical protein
MYLNTKRLEAKLDEAAAYYNKLIIFTNLKTKTGLANVIEFVTTIIESLIHQIGGICVLT